ncbi:nucleoside phosphorylase [Streptococcus respiraculi]|uniref:nucleoside phosphorylase n=1 Tax=Streptococcus respiraculi TaxID=2021971 RepID=UPI000E70DC3B|nr:nucleoside phosphorylase [Streptococcus respiraculi]
MILEEFDSNRLAIINPEDLIAPLPDFPEVAVSCFARGTFDRLLRAYPQELLFTTAIANVEIPIYRIVVAGRNIAIFNAPVGSPACVAVLEDLIALGMRKLVLFGTCGVLDEDIAETSIIVPLSAIRDEGTSYHYVKASDEILLNTDIQQAFIQFLEDKKISHVTGKVWTTDGIYRETIDKLRKRKDSGAICVDMECSAVAALACFRGVDIAHFFYAADHLSEEEWDMRTLANDADLDEKDKVADLAVQFALTL